MPFYRRAVSSSSSNMLLRWSNFPKVYLSSSVVNYLSVWFINLSICVRPIDFCALYPSFSMRPTVYHKSWFGRVSHKCFEFVFKLVFFIDQVVKYPTNISCRGSLSQLMWSFALAFKHFLRKSSARGSSLFANFKGPIFWINWCPFKRPKRYAMQQLSRTWSSRVSLWESRWTCKEEYLHVAAVAFLTEAKVADCDYAFIDQDALASSHCMSKDCTGEQLLFQDLDTAIADLRSDVDCFFLRYVPCPVPT